MSTTPLKPPLVQARDLAMSFDVSPPWLNRVLERKPRTVSARGRWREFRDREGQDAGAGRRVGLWQEHRGALAGGAVRHPRAADFQFDGQDAHGIFKTAGGLKLRSRIQMIFQDPYASLNPRWIVEDIIGEPLIEHGLITDKDQLKAKVGDLLSPWACRRWTW
jgi:peptide/nickel transport system ATP-binding protein